MSDRVASDMKVTVTGIIKAHDVAKWKIVKGTFFVQSCREKEARGKD